MTEPNQAPFAFTDARTADARKQGGAGAQVQSAQPAAASHPRRRGRKPAEEAPPLKVDLMHAIRAAAILDETDANAFAAIVKVMNQQGMASRNRIARALVTVFA